MMTVNKVPQQKVKHRILIVDDHPVVRKGVSQLLDEDPDLAVSGEAENMAGALKSIKEHKLDLVLLDISLGKESGLDVLRRLKARYPGLAILIFSMHDESYYAERVLRAGARGYIMKHVMAESIIQAVQKVLSGGIYLSPKMSGLILQQLSEGRALARGSPIGSLTDREIEIYRLLGEGLTAKMIAAKLHLSVKTIDSHRESMKKKLGLSNARELFRHAILWVHEEAGK